MTQENIKTIEPLNPGEIDVINEKPENSWQPKIVAFFCNWCTYTAADLAGVSRIKHSPTIRVIRVMCSGRVDPQFILDAFSKGADGVLIGGCHPGDCHYIEGNYKCMRRLELLKRIVRDLGIDDDRLRLEWISASEGEKVKVVVNDMTNKIKKLGPLNLPKMYRNWDEELNDLELEIIRKGEMEHV